MAPFSQGLEPPRFPGRFNAIRTLVELGVNPDKQLANGIGSALDFTFMKHDDTRYLKAMLDGGLSLNHQPPDSAPMLQNDRA